MDGETSLQVPQADHEGEEDRESETHKHDQLQFALEHTRVLVGIWVRLLPVTGCGVDGS